MKKTMADREFMVPAPVLWNSLPLSVRQATNFIVFKGLVKSHLFSKAFCSDFIVSQVIECITGV